MKQYELLKDLPCLKKGAIFTYKEAAGLWYIEDKDKFMNVNIEDVTDEWFKEVKEEKKPKFKVWAKVVVNWDTEITYWIITSLDNWWYKIWYSWTLSEEHTRLATPEEIELYFS